MQGEGEDEENDMFSTNRKFNPNDLVYSGTVSLTLTLTLGLTQALALALAPTISDLLGHGEPRIRASDPLCLPPLATHHPLPSSIPLTALTPRPPLTLPLSHTLLTPHSSLQGAPRSACGLVAVPREPPG